MMKTIKFLKEIVEDKEESKSISREKAQYLLSNLSDIDKGIGFGLISLPEALDQLQKIACMVGIEIDTIKES